MAEELALRSPLALFLNLVDLFFPPRCVGGCKREGQWICGPCSETLISGDFPNQAHFYNLEPFIPAAALFDFDQPLIRELLHTLKYNGIYTIEAVIEKLATQGFDSDNFLSRLVGENSAVLIPVPISKAKRKMRGYNQAELVAKALGSWLGMPVWPDALRRLSNKQSQVGKGRDDRSLAVSQAFEWAGTVPEHYRDKNWILVDDLVTTGSTLRACLTCLQPHCSKRLGALTFAYKP